MEVSEHALTCDKKCEFHSAHDRAIDKHDNRLDTHGQEIDGIQKCLERLIALQERSDSWQKETSKKLDEIEHKPAQRWNQLITAGISAVVGALVSFFSTSIMIG